MASNMLDVMEHKADSSPFISWFCTSTIDPSLSTRKNRSAFLSLLVYVDDVILASNNFSNILSVNTSLNDTFKIKDLGKLKYFFGLEISHSITGINVYRRKYTIEIFDAHRFFGCKPVDSPMDASYQCSKDDSPRLSNITP